jgi:anthranilate synthase
MNTKFTSPTGIAVMRKRTALRYETALDGFAERLDRAPGALFSSGVDYPGRYSRWEFGFEKPPVEIIGRGKRLTFRALSPRGERILAILAPLYADAPDARIEATTARELVLEIVPGTAVFPEEARSQQPSLVSPLKRLVGEFAGIADGFMGVYGAFGYDLLFQFEPIKLRHERADERPDLHLFLPDRIFVADRRKEQAFRYDYDFARGELSTEDAGREMFARPSRKRAKAPKTGEITSDYTADEYAAMVDLARERMRVGDIFEVVLSRNFTAPFDGLPSTLFRKLKQVNPSPYEFLLQFGSEQLVGTSPEMFVRVEGDRVESCPLSGTARRTGRPMEDAERLRALLNSEKDEVELTMCTDVDRNDKSRICRPGTVRLLGRRQIETYAGLYHTADHVEGRLREGLTGIDAFLSHMWAVTLTGAPKKMAVEIVEELEKSPRRWYGGAVGAFAFNGDVNTGITIRTVHLEAGQANYRAGATLVWDSVGKEEDEETRTKASALFRAVGDLRGGAAKPASVHPAVGLGAGKRVILVDNEDSFVHTLADYFRQTGADVSTYRHNVSFGEIVRAKPDLVVHSPGPGRPEQFGVPALVLKLAAADIPQFGVCLGLQGMVEAFGGALDVLPAPRHGKIWDVQHDGNGLFAGVPSPARFGAYHSLTARHDGFPADDLDVIARTEAGLVMAIRHRRLPIAAVQFHPESILSLTGEFGLTLVGNVLRELVRAKEAAAVA